MYGPEVIKHFQKPRNMGKLENPDAVGEVGNPVCGDMMTLYLKIKDNAIVDIGFETLGCVAAIATSSMITEMAKGKTLEEAEKITIKDVADALGSLPPVKMHCSDLAVKALRKAIGEYRSKT